MGVKRPFSETLTHKRCIIQEVLAREEYNDDDVVKEKKEEDVDGDEGEEEEVGEKRKGKI